MNPRLAIASMALAAAAGIAACAGTRTPPQSIPERLTPGIFLDPPEADVFPRGGVARKVGPDGLQLTKRSEGFVPRLYEDAVQYCTIAYGHLVKKARCDGSEPEEFRAGVTEPRGAEMLATDMEKAERAVTGAVPVDLTEGQYGALCDFVYNVGASNFRSSTLLKVVNAGDVDAVAPQLRRWVKANGQELPGLKLRREREIDLFYQGLTRPRGGVAELAPVDVRSGE